MPPEQLPWDRRDFRKHERSASDPRFVGGGGGFGGRWRDNHHPHAPPPPSPHQPPYHHHQNPHQPQRWYSDFRSSRPIPTGHGKQGGWHMYSDEAGHGFPPFGSRHNDRTSEDDSLRPLDFRGDGRYLRNSRESRGGFSHKDWRSPNWEISAGSIGPGKPTAELNNQKSQGNTSSHDNQTKSSDSAIPVTVLPVDLQKSDSKEKHEDGTGADWLSRPSQNSAPSSGPGKPTIELNNHKPVVNTSACYDNRSKFNDPAYAVSLSPLDQHQTSLKEKRGDCGIANGITRSTQKSEKENVLGSIDWRPLKWSRSGSLSSRCSAFSNSSSTKASEMHHNEIGADLRPESMMPVESSAAGTCVASIAPSSSDNTNSRKKPRLGWGEGLAKYEKKKVEVPDSFAGNVGIFSVPDTENSHSPSVNLLDKSPTVTSLPMSPTTPCSVACSFSPGIEENESIKKEGVDQINVFVKSSLSMMPQTDYEKPTFNLESIDELSSVANLSSLINELRQSNGPGSVETDYLKSTSMSKLLVWKGSVLKALEVTESEIDSLETKSKSLVSEARSFCPHPSVLELPVGSCSIKPCSQTENASSFTTERNLLKPAVPGDVNNCDTTAGPEDKLSAPMDEETHSPVRASPRSIDSSGFDLSFKTSKWVENLSMNPISSCSFDQTSCRNMDHIYDSIISSNKDFANKVSDELNKLIPSQWHHCDVSASSHVSSFPSDSLEIKRKILMRKRALKFSEKVLILKYQVFRHFWKEGRVISLRKIRGKSHKKFDLSQTLCNANRISSQSRLLHSAGNLLTVPAEELVDLVNGLLSSFSFKPFRSTLKMPSLILDRQAKKSRFVSNNGLVDDPSAAERERSMINPWTAEEREVFIDKLATFGKDFKRIASFLDQKTIADCVEFYYKNHKSECFSRAKRKSDGAEKKPHSNTYLLGAAKRFHQDLNSVSLDILGEVANASSYNETQSKQKSRMFLGSSRYQNSPRVEESISQIPEAMGFCSNETAAVDVLAGICGSLSSEAMSSCITSSLDPADGNQDRKLLRHNLCIKHPLTPDVTQSVDDEGSEESCEETDSVDWTDEEKSMFIQAVSSYGKDFLMISRFMRTRSRDQCKVFFSKARKCLGLDLIQPTAAYGASDSDTEGAYVIGTDSFDNISSDRQECHLSTVLKFSDQLDFAGACNSDMDVKICPENSGRCPLNPIDAEPLSRNYDEPLDNKPVKENDIVNGHEPVADSEAMLVPSEVESEPADEEDHGFFAASGACDNNSMFKGSDWCHSKEKPEEACISAEVLKVNDTEIRKLADHQLAFNESCPIDAGSTVLVKSDEKAAAIVNTCIRNTSCAISSQHGDHSESMDSSSVLFPVPIKYQRNSFNSDGYQNVGSSVVGAAYYQRILQRDCISRHSLSSQSKPYEPTQNLKGHRVSVKTCEEITRNSDSKTGVAPGCESKRLSSSHPRAPLLQECDHSRHQDDIVPEWLHSPQQNGNHCRYQSGVSSEEDKPSRNGDVKLFGKILVSSELNSCLGQTTGDRKESVNLKFDSKPDGTTFGYSHNSGAETMTPPLPASSILTRCSSVCNYASPDTAELCPTPSDRMIEGNDCLSNGSSVPGKALSGCCNGLPGNGLVQNQGLPPLASDMKQPQDLLFSETRRGNEYDDAMSHSRGIGVMNRHYSKPQSLSVAGGNLVRDGDAWRRNGDVGR